MDYLLLFGSLLSYLLLYKYIALFVLIFVAGIGFPVPSNTLLMAVGAFASQGYFDFWLSLAVALVANVLGDLVGYFLMRLYGPRIIKKNYHKRFSFIAQLEPYVITLESYIKKHQRATVFFSRFVGSASTVVNFLAGLVPVPLNTFIMYDALGNVINILIMIVLGFFLDESWQKIAAIVGVASTAVWIVIIVVFIIFAIIIKRRRARTRARHKN